MVEKTINRFFSIEGREERNAVFAVKNYVKSAAELKHVVNKGPEIDKIKSATPYDMNPVNCLVTRAFTVVAAEYGNGVAGLHPALGKLMNIDFCSAGKDVFSVAPVE